MTSRSLMAGLALGWLAAGLADFPGYGLGGQMALQALSAGRLRGGWPGGAGCRGRRAWPVARRRVARRVLGVPCLPAAAGEGLRLRFVESLRSAGRQGFRSLGGDGFRSPVVESLRWAGCKSFRSPGSDGFRSASG